jgi:hypothetical protein
MISEGFGKLGQTELFEKPDERGSIDHGLERKHRM